LAFDTGEYAKSSKIISELETKNNARLRHIFSTHKHEDHVGGNLEWLRARGEEVTVWGADLEVDNIPGLKRENAMHDIKTMTIGDLCVCCLHTPGHTSDHCTFVVTHVTPESTKIPFVFCGDTLFTGGCGRLLGGTADQLLQSLRTIMSLPNESLMFCGHEYTIKNLEFAKKLEPDNPHIEQKLEMCRELREKDEFTVGNQIQEERMYNPFVRCFQGDRETREYYEQITGESETLRVFQKLRALKDQF
jgi:hydroxyacylglutathione hydrolase